MASMGKRGPEWDLNKWKWDGDLFIARPVDPHPQKFIPIPAAGNSSNSSSTCSDDVHPRDLDRKRRVIVIEDEEEGDGDEGGTLALKLGVPSQVGLEEKKSKLGGVVPVKGSVCQVEGCGFDLSHAKDYHRRHKVCDMHSKATKALVGNVMQRFCQQCSRFHDLEEFDEGKRSCRRRLAGHNKRRRKTQPDPVVPVITGQPANDEHAKNYAVMSLLRMLSSAQTNNRSDSASNHDLVANLLRNLQIQSGSIVVNDMPGLVHEAQKLLRGGINGGNIENVSALMSVVPPRPPRPTNTHIRMPASEFQHTLMHSSGDTVASTQAASSEKPESTISKDSPPTYSEVRDSAVGRTKVNNFDLNDIYVDSDDGFDDLERSPVTGTGSVDCPSWAQQDSASAHQSSPPQDSVSAHQSSPPQASGNSDSASAQSPSSSSGETQSRTDRIVCKLFGKEPSEFPMALRGQVLDWLNHTPTDMESYIRPGCVILTIYLHLAEPIWDELSTDLGSSLSRLLDNADDAFWKTGWVYTRVPNRIVFSYNGQIMVDSSLPSQDSYCSRILSVSPIAVSISEVAQFQIKGSKLSGRSTRLLCALEGEYLAQEALEYLPTDNNTLTEDNEIECVNFSCTIPSVTGRGFIEVEDPSLSSNFFPFIVAEKDICSEIRMLESVLDVTSFHEANEKQEAKHQAMDFLNEMGWLLHRCQVKIRLGYQKPNTDLFSFKRFRWLMEFSMDQEWGAVIKKLLDILLDGNVGYGKHPNLEVALSEMGLLHRAVRKNSTYLVDILLRYVPLRSSDEFSNNFFFRPDVKGPAGLTPLHIAAGKDGSDAVLDALTNDTGKVGIEAWKTARDSTGSTPEDYARLRGHYTYIHLVQRKISSTLSNGSVIVDMPGEINSDSSKHNVAGISSLEIATSLSTNMTRGCRACKSKLAYGFGGRSRAYRPAMLSMVAIAAVCVCVALFFKTSPVVYVFQPFQWEAVDFGSI